MCGIAGIIGQGSSALAEMNLMLGEIKNRGTNFPVIKELENAIFGHILLPILDAQTGTQPLFNSKKTVLIVFNGQIYNYKDLKQDLIEKGYHFHTKTDTEVVLYLYEEYQEKMLDLLEGMFAFVIYNLKNGGYFAARDPFGIKPFYYSNVNDKFYFSSELKALKKVDCTILNELEAGFCIQNERKTKWYTSLNTIQYDTKISYQYAKEKLKGLLIDAVKKRVDTHLPIVVFFSGGIDSTIILNLARQFHQNVLALIIGHTNTEDVRYALRYCKENDIKYRHIDFEDEELIALIPELVYRTETFEPNPIRGAALSYLLSKEAKNLGYKIALCGEGSDEIFAGYGDFLQIEEANLFLKHQIDLTKDLYRTQLLRVDKTAMSFNLEVRVPFLDKVLVEFALALPREFKVPRNKSITKFILREAFKDDLPTYIYERQKMTLMKGSGVGAVNKEAGIFSDFVNQKMSDKAFLDLKEKYPKYNLNDKETAFYFEIFFKYYGDIPFAQKRTSNARIEIQEG